MQVYYFYRHPENNYIFIDTEKHEHYPLAYFWVDCTREDIVNRVEQWHQEINTLTGLYINEFHRKDILNIEHPCAFDVMDDYDLLVFRKLITPDDQIQTTEAEQHESVFGITTTPISMIMTPKILVTVREKGNKSFEEYLKRISIILTREPSEQNKPRKLPDTPLDLALRLLNSMIDGYLDLRAPLTHRVEYWQQQLLQGRKRFTEWNMLLQESMALQQIENICEEQIESLQELHDEIVENYHHLTAERLSDPQDIMLVRMDDLISHIERIQKHTVRLRAAIQAAMDLHFSAIANQTNENMRILAIITAVFAPLTLLTGIYGMNFEFIPGLKSPIGFWIMLIVMLGTTAFLIYYFYRRHLMGLSEKSVIEMLAQQNSAQHFDLFKFMNDPIKHTLKEVEKFTKLK
ncbi:magnesium transporter CorA family protein [Acinetobacter gerneri]|jgi:Mg2+ and Co2+ transporter CorA|uniref:magnesium transporter CorA family protein n=1 Tax=Acinetobacter gerneri TaxID=202952 RepID=UPI0023F3FD00|nr:magnesium transporter CorA family protein [Acinetobacter gerneri]MCH4244169.1 magnesium transporter CorA family protein [Acinetobacter gerneri]